MLFTENNIPEVNSSNYSLDHNNCPNCWGYVQWDGKECMAVASIDKGSNIEIFSQNGFIRRFVKKYIG